MIFKASDKNHKNIKIFDIAGNEIDGVIKFDTKTCKITMMLLSKKRKVIRTKTGGIATITYELSGAYATVNGKKVEE